MFLERQKQLAIQKISSNADMKKLFRLASAIYKLTKKDIYLVGGSIRNVLLGLPVNDIDITGELSAKELLKVFDIENDKRILQNKCKNPKKHWSYKGSIVQEALGIVNFYMKGANVGGFENQAQYAQFRVEKSYNTKRTPDDVVLGVSLEEDAIRRDCTINSIYYNIRTKQFVDPVNGIEDLFRGVINTHLKEEIFVNDPLRIFRLIRMKSLLKQRFQQIEEEYKAEQENYETLKGENIYIGRSEELDNLHYIMEEYNPQKEAVIDNELLEVLQSSLEEIKKLPQARINQELFKGAKYNDYIQTLAELRVIDVLHENFALARGLDQKTKFHKYDTLEHILKVVEAGYKFFPNESPEFYLALLFHDVGKPTQFLAQRKFEAGSKNFYLAKELNSHEKVGGKIVRELFEYEKKEVKNLITAIVERHQDELFFLNEAEMSVDIEKDLREGGENKERLLKKYLPFIEETVQKLYSYVSEKRKIEEVKALYETLLKMHFCDKYGCGRFYEKEREELLWKQKMFLEYLFDYYYVKKNIYQYRITYQEKERISKLLTLDGIAYDLHHFFFNKLQRQIFVGKIKRGRTEWEYLAYINSGVETTQEKIEGRNFDNILKFYSQLAWDKNVFWRAFNTVRYGDVSKFDMTALDIKEKEEEIKKFLDNKSKDTFSIKTVFAEGRNNTVFMKLRPDNREEVLSSLKKKSTGAFFSVQYGIIPFSSEQRIPEWDVELIVMELRYFNAYIVFDGINLNSILTQLSEFNKILRENETL